MISYEKLTNFDITLNQKTAFHLIDCYPNNPIYEEVVASFQNLQQDVLQAIHPAAYIKFGFISEETARHSEGNLTAGTTVIYVLLTIGDEVTNLGGQYFQAGEYLSGMLVNAMADTYLFQMDDIVLKHLKTSCIGRQFHLARKLEAPENIPMILQKDILDEIKEVEPLSIQVTEGFMYTTLKTMGSIFILSDKDTPDFKGHNCHTCSMKDCKLRKYDNPRITVLGRGNPIL